MSAGYWPGTYYYWPDNGYYYWPATYLYWPIYGIPIYVGCLVLSQSSSEVSLSESEVGSVSLSERVCAS